MDVLGSKGERRDAARAASLRSGFALSHDGQQREACVVGNLSESGALLMVERPSAIGSEILLLIDGEKNRRPARVVWRTEAAVAVSFVTCENRSSQNDGWVFAPGQQVSA